jgi:hypothetical protein
MNGRAPWHARVPVVAAFEALEAEDFAGCGWTTLDGEDVPLLPAEVWDEVPETGEAS